MSNIFVVARAYIIQLTVNSTLISKYTEAILIVK